MDLQDSLCLSAAPSDSQLPAEAVAGEGDSFGDDSRLVEGALVPFAHPYKCQGLTPSVCKIKSSPKSHSSSIRQAQADGLGLERQRLMDFECSVKIVNTLTKTRKDSANRAYSRIWHKFPVLLLIKILRWTLQKSVLKCLQAWLDLGLCVSML